MSTDDTTANSPESPSRDNGSAQGSDPDEASGESTEDTTDGGDAKLRREASRYRRQLREAEGERDGLRGRVEAMQRAEVERLVADQIAVPADVWLAGALLPDLLDDDGNVDPAKVTDAVKAVLTDRPGLRRLNHVAFDGGVRTAAPNTGPTWHDAIRAKP